MKQILILPLMAFLLALGSTLASAKGLTITPASIAIRSAGQITQNRKVSCIVFSICIFTYVNLVRGWCCCFLLRVGSVVDDQ